MVKFSLLIPQDLGWIQAVKNSYSCCICPLVFSLFLGNKKKFQQANATAINTRMLPAVSLSLSDVKSRNNYLT